MEDKGMNEMGCCKVAKLDEPIVNASEDVKWGTAQLPCVHAPDCCKNAVSEKK